MEYLSEKVSVDRSAGRMSVAISGRATSGQHALLIAWALAWLACGIIVIVYRQRVQDGAAEKQYLLAFLAFWAYFLVAIGRAVLWRLKGFELWRIKDGMLVIKDSLFGYGKANTYFTENIQKLGLIAADPTSWKYQWNQSAWVIGGERLGFEHLGKKVAFGKNLNDDEARRLTVLLKEALKEQRKAASAPEQH